MSFLTDLYKGNANFGTNPLANMPGGNMFLKNYSMPNGVGSYSSAGTAPVAPIVPSYAGNQNVPNAPTAPIFTGNQTYNNPPAPVAPPVDVFAKYRDPKTGKIMSPEEYAVYLGNKIPASRNAGSIVNYATNQRNNPNQSIDQLTNTARDLNNARNDLSVGETSMFAGNDTNAAGEKIIYSPTELNAIRKAEAGIYDPALSDVFNKLEAKKKSDEEASSRAWEKEKLALQHGYSMEEKGLTAGGTGLAGEYVKGANPAVDAWAQRIFDNTAKITDIPASQKGMRDAVTIALTASGNDLSGRPTVTELGKAAKTEAESILQDLTDRKGTSAVGASRFWGGALWGALPGTDAYDFKNSVTNLVSNLSLDAVKYLKGQGAVSDAERALLQNAVTKLKLSQSETEFKETLQGIIDRLTGGESSKPQTMVLNGVTLQLQADGTYE